MADGREILTDLLPEELAERIAPLGVSAHLARRVFAQKVHHGAPGWIVRDLAHERARALEARFAVPRLEVVDRRVSPTDGFTKYLFRLHDGLQVDLEVGPDAPPAAEECARATAPAGAATGGSGWGWKPWGLVLGAVAVAALIALALLKKRRRLYRITNG